MPEAVIVATARSPIGRACKGSLTSIRPDDLAAQMVTRGAGQGAAARSGRHRRPDPRLRAARRRAGLQHGAGGRGAARPRSPARHHRQPVLLVVAADDPDGLPRDQGRRGRRLHLGRRRVREQARQGQQRFLARHAEPRLRRRPGSGPSSPRPGTPGPGTTRARTGTCPTSTSRWAQTAENVAELRGVSREQQDEFGVRSQNLAEKAIANGFWQRRSRRSPCRTAPWSAPTTAPGPGPRSRRSPRSSRCSARTARSPRGTAARSTTAPRRSS